MTNGPLNMAAISRQPEQQQKPGTIDMNNPEQVDKYITQLEDEIQRMREQGMQNDLAYGPPLQTQKTVMPDERQLQYLYSTQPKKKDDTESIAWNKNTFDETEILRHIQFGQFTETERDQLLREYADIQILCQQQSRRRVAINAQKRLYLRIISSKSLVLDGRDPAIVLLHQPTNKSVYEQKIPQAQPQKRTGFWSSIFGGGK